MRVNWDPFYELIQLQDRTNRLLQEGFGRTTVGITQMPAVDVYEQEKKLVVEASMPNFSEQDIEANLTNEGLEIKAEHKTEEVRKDRKYLIQETTGASFYRFINLPAGSQTDQAKARFENGILRIEIPVDKPQSPQKLAIETPGGKPGLAQPKNRQKQHHEEHHEDGQQVS